MFHLLYRLRERLESKRGDPRYFCRRHTRPVRIRMQEKFIGGFYYSLAKPFDWTLPFVGSEVKNAPFLYSLGVTP